MEQQHKLVLHYLNNSRSQRIIWLLEELGVPYSIKSYTRNPATWRAPEDLLKVHPLGKAPVITDGNVTLAESGPIIEYLIEKYGNGRFKPADAGKMDNLYFSHYSEGSIMPNLVNQLTFTLIAANAPLVLRPLLGAVLGKVKRVVLLPEAKRHLDFVESHLSNMKDGWFAGGTEPTAADFMMIYPLEAACARCPELVGPKVKEYVQRVHERPAYLRALERGGKYEHAKV